MNLIKIIFWTILLIGLLIRTYNLATLPASLHVDEASFAYNAYSVLTTGKDEHGVPFPFYFQAFGEYKSPIQTYSMIPFIFLFGLNEFSIRLTSVIYGLLGLITTYLLTKELFKEHEHGKIIALFAMFFLAISPWDIQFSRLGWEMMSFVFFTTLGFYLFFKAQQVPRILPLAAVSLMVGLYTYYIAWLFIPSFGIVLSLLYFRFFMSHKKETIISCIIVVIMLVPIFQTISSHGLTRWQQVNVFSNPPTNETILQHIEINYIQHFSLAFLFTKGDIGMPGQPNTYDSVRGMGELYLFQLPLIIIGLYYLWKDKRKTALVLLFWLLLYPLGSMFTDKESPLARRSVIGVIPFQIISAFGMVYFLQMVEKMKKYSFATMLVTALLITFSLLYYLYVYFVTYTSYSSGYFGFQYGSKQIVQYFVAHESSYDDLVMSPYIFSPYIYFDFYAPGDCIKCKTGLPDYSYTPGRKQLFALPPYYLASHTQFIYSPVENIYYPNGTLAFILTEISGEKGIILRR